MELTIDIAVNSCYIDIAVIALTNSGNPKRYDPRHA